MKITIRFQISSISLFGGAYRQIVAAFVTAQLVTKHGGRHELIGDTADDHAATREWCSLFAPEVIFSSAPRRNPVIAFAE
jgi:hypothetical protein